MEKNAFGTNILYAFGSLEHIYQARHGGIRSSVIDLHGGMGSGDRHFPENPQAAWITQ